MEDIFSEDQRLVHGLLCLVLSVITRGTYATESIGRHVFEGLINWESDLPFPKSPGKVLRRWNVLWNSKKHEVDSANRETNLPDNLLQALSVLVRIGSQILIAS